MKLEKYIEITGVVHCVTGLRIGGSKDTLGIGETDNPIIRNPITRLPYLPGSSLKGKIRSLLELKHSPDSQRNGKPCACGNCDICSLFGCGDAKKGNEPTRLIFRDAYLTEESAEKLKQALPGSYVEVKTEIAMDRKTGKAQQGALREQERVPEGTEFQFSMLIRFFDEDEKRIKKFYSLLAEAFDMLEQDGLGGSISRGYGQVEIYSDANPDKDVPMYIYLRGLTK